MSPKFFAAALAAVFLAAPVFADGIEIHDAFAITSRPGAPSGSAYMVIENHGTSDDRLVSVSAPVAQMVQLHAHIFSEDGVARMEELAEGIALPAGEHAQLSQGGDHVMFMGITDPFEDGMIIPLTLHFDVAGDVLVEVPVDLTRLGGGGGHDMHDHDMDHHDENGGEEHAH